MFLVFLIKVIFLQRDQIIIRELQTHLAMKSKIRFINKFLKGKKNHENSLAFEKAQYILTLPLPTRMVTHHNIDGPSFSKIYQKELYYKLGIWHLNLTHKNKTSWMVSHHHQDGHPPSKGWLPTIQNLTEGSVLQTCYLAHRLNHKIKTR